MKRAFLIITIIFFTIVMCITNYSLAADEYTFDLQYTGTITKNEEKSANVLLIGQNGTLYSKVRIKVDVTGPATPKILATDSSNVEHNIIEIGYWGPAEGFTVQGDFTNTTPIKATFPEAGKYTVTLSLINLENSNSIIATKSFEVDVLSNDPVVENNIIENNVVTNNINNIEELPKTGISIWEYVLCFAIVGVIISIIGKYMNLKK